MKQIILYGISDANNQYRVVKYHCINEENISIWYIRHCANIMRMENPSIQHVYAVDNRHGLKREYVESIKRNTIESCAIFKDTLEREGLKVI
jgi:hypothetical protein